MATTTVLTAEKQLKNKLKLGLNINTVRDLRLKNNLASVTAGGDLKVEGSLYKPKLTGLLNIRPGSRLYLAGNQYDVEKATVEFFGSDFVEPNLDITLYTLQRDFQTDTYYEVFLPFGGPLSNIQFKTVRSIPSLSQDQIFSLITQGTVESEHVASSRTIFQQQILSTIAGQVIGAPGTAIARRSHRNQLECVSGTLDEIERGTADRAGGSEQGDLAAHPRPAIWTEAVSTGTGASRSSGRGGAESGNQVPLS